MRHARATPVVVLVVVFAFGFRFCRATAGLLGDGSRALAGGVVHGHL